MAPNNAFSTIGAKARLIPYADVCCTQPPSDATISEDGCLRIE